MGSESGFRGAVVRGGTALLAATLLGGGFLHGCAVLRELGAAGGLDFSLAGVSDVRLAGVEMERFQRFEELGASELLTLGRAFSEGEVPLSLTLRVRADNPDDNPRARLTALEWDLLLRDRETVSGALDDEVVVEPGESAAVPLRAELDLRRFFEGGNLEDLVSVGLALARDDLSGDDLRLRIHPRVATPLGAVQYPEPLVLSPGENSRPEGG